MNYPGKEGLNHNISCSDSHDKELLRAAERRLELKASQDRLIAKLDIGGQALAGATEVTQPIIEDKPEDLAA